MDFETAVHPPRPVVERCLGWRWLGSDLSLFPHLELKRQDYLPVPCPCERQTI
ncbi:MAG: hypothetical protein JXA41_13075 [Deltaproteobacteria bacterium]|nr:hypothetical protein [Deltaproteobacteria bacterium]